MSIKVNAFQGMNNVKVKDKGGLEMPSMILNANVDPDGSLQKRPGCTQVAALPGAHSLWTNNKEVTLCMAKGKLYRLVDHATPTELADTGQPDAAVSYVEVGSLIYMSNKHWTGMYDPAQGMKAWGDPVPDAPVLIPVSGGLSAGVYQVCVTTTNEYGRLSGNSLISSITLSSSGGISITNLPVNASVWMTDPNGSQLLYAGSNAIVTEPPGSPEPIPTLWGSSPSPISNIRWAFGRVWGCRGNKVYYSEPYQPELFRLSEAYFDMDSPVLMVAESASGMFIGCQHKTFFLGGSNPLEMLQVEVGPGVIPGSLCIASDLGEYGKNVPVWVGTDGVYIGLAGGQVMNIVKERIQIDPQQVPGAAIYRVKDGRQQMLFSMKHNQPKGQEVGFGDEATCEVVRRGTVI